MRKWLKHPRQFLATANQPTVPERPETIDAQMEQLQGGVRRVVMIPNGTKMPSGVSKHLSTIRVPGAGNFIFDATAIAPREIRRAARFNRLPDILGATEGGMGTLDKTELNGPTAAVLGKTREGTTTQGTLTDEANLSNALRQTEKLIPRGGRVEIAKPEAEIINRQWLVPPEHFLSQLG